MSRYDDIMGMERPESPRHKPMSMSQRAAQFAPFAALTGHSEAIAETARLTTPAEILSADESALLSRQLGEILAKIENTPLITVIHFVADERKEGGIYERYTGHIRKYDDYEHTLTFTDGKIIAIPDIIVIE